MSILLIIGPGIHAQIDIFNEEWRWAHFKIESGLPSNNIYKIIETRDSTIWVVTEEGISWYDGFQWIPIKSDEALKSHRPFTISEYQNNRLLIQYGTEVYLISKTDISKLPVNEVQSSVYFSNDSILILKNSTLFILKNNILTPLEVSQGLAKGKVYRLIRTKSGHVWVTTRDGIYRWENGIWCLVFQSGGEILNEFIADNSKGNTFFYLELPVKLRGLWKWLPNNGTLRRIEGEYDDLRMMSINQSDEIVAIYHSAEARFYSGEKLYSSTMLQNKIKNVQDIQFRFNGDLMIATADGINYFKASSSRWRIFRYSQIDSRNRIDEILFTSKGELWLGTGNGLLIYDTSGKRKSITHINDTPLIAITGLEEDREGNIWISSGGSFNGAYRWDYRKWQFYSVTKDTSGGRFHKIRKDRKGRLWFLGLSKSPHLKDAIDPGAYVYESGVFTKWGTSEGLLHDRVYSFAEDSCGSLWFGTRFGISKWHNHQWTHWTVNDGLQSGVIFTLTIDSSNNVWFGHGGNGAGLGVIDTSRTIKYFTSADGLINDYVYDLRVDVFGILWISTEGGLSSYNRGAWSSYNERTGLHYNLLWPILPLEKEIYVGTRGQGLAILDRRESYLPEPRILINNPIIDKQDVYLSWRVFSYWGELSPDEILTRYRTSTSEWSAWSKLKEVKLHLTSGEYVFFVQAKGLFGGYSTEGKQISFKILPPIYFRPYVFYPAVVFILGLITVGIYLIIRKRKYDAELRRREAKFRAVTDMTHSAIFIYRDDLSILFVNAAMEQLTGYLRDELLIRKVTDIILHECQSSLIEKKPASQHNYVRPQRKEFRIKKKDGTVRWIDLAWGSILFQGIQATIGTAFDITERNLAENRIKTLASELSSTEQKTRRRMASFLHDKIGHALALSKMKVESLMQNASDKSANLAFQDVHRLIHDAIQTTRSFTFELSPPILFDLGLVPAIEWLTEELQKQHNIKVFLHKPLLKISLSDEVRNTLFEGTRELLLNAIKHSNAHIIDVTITTFNFTISITVQDNGVGFDVSIIEIIMTEKKSFGLFNLRERLKDIGGMLEINSQMNKGSTVRLIAPLNINERLSV